MKLLLDENLSPALANNLQDIFPGSQHVHDCNLGASDDSLVWDHAGQNGFVIVSKNSDFHDLTLLRGAGPKVVWIRSGNCSTADIEKLLRSRSVLIHQLESGQSGSTLVLS